MGAEGTPDSVNPSVVDEEEGLPSPPLDELAFFAAPTAGIELSQVFFMFPSGFKYICEYSLCVCFIIVG